MATETVEISERLRSLICKQKLVVFAGAGISSGPPTRLPGWFKINRMIVEALCVRVEFYLGRSEYLDQIRAAINERREIGRFPPDYQAQILEEYAGQDYFRALQSLDVNVRNAGHDALAHLARNGTLAAILTTNFDRLIEQALDAVGVEYEVASEAASYERCYRAIKAGNGLKLPVLKVHGCVSDANSLVDTLKQRLLGRNSNLNRALELLIERHPWVYTGFSAADLETDYDYLRILPCAERSPGIGYVQWPGAQGLEPGAVKLLEKYSGKAETIKAETHDVFAAIAQAVEAPPPRFEHAGTSDTDAIVQETLTSWAAGLHPAVPINCLAAVCESNAMSFAAFELLHRFWKDVLPKDRKGEHFERYRQVHGRLGMGYGQLSLLEDSKSTKGEESLQNLLRRAHAGDPLAAAWAGITFMWAGNREWAMQMLLLHHDKLEGDHVSKEVSVDCWMAKAEIFYFYCEPEVILRSWPGAWKYAEMAGDLPRQAKCGALAALHYAEFDPGNYKEFVNLAQPVFDRAARLNDPGINGFISLAAGRYLTRTVENPIQAAEELRTAYEALKVAGRPPWALYAQMEFAKALADNRQMDKAASMLNTTNKLVDRWQILCVVHAEAVGQLNLMVGQKAEARTAFENAIEFATKAGIVRKAEVLRKALANC